MPFEIPSGELSVFSAQGLADLRARAQSEYDTLLASVSEDTVTDEQLERLEALRAFCGATGAVATELASRTARASRFSTLTEPEPVADPEPEPVVEAQPNAVTASTTLTVETVVEAAPSVAQIAAQGGPASVEVATESAGPQYHTILAAADLPNFATGTTLSILDVAKAFEAKTSGYRGLGKMSAPLQHSIAMIQRSYPSEFTVTGDEKDAEIMARAADESRLPGGSLVAAAGWCAPSETDYSICYQGSTDGLASFPEVQATRGGIRHNTGIEFDGIYGDGTGYNNLTEEQVAAGSPTKVSVEINCPSFTDTRLGVTALWIKGNIVATRGYPEYTAKFVQASLDALAHRVNLEQIAAVVTGSTAVTLAATDPWVSDGSVVSQVFSAVDLAITDLKYRLRLPQNATLEVKVPFWLKAQMRADWIRRNANANPNLADAYIAELWATRNASPDYVYDWQDAFSSAGQHATVGMGSDTAQKLLPVSLQFLVYPAGTWVRAVRDVINLNSVYDSALLPTNQHTQLFLEDGWAMVKRCPVSRVYTVPICPTGATGAQRSIDCVTP